MKSEQLYFTPQSDLSAGQHFPLDEETSHHLSKVLRYNLGDHIQLTNGRGIRATARIERLDKHICLVSIEEVSAPTAPPRPLTLAVSPLKNPQRWEWMIEKAVELGVSEIVPLTCKRTEKKGMGKEERTLRIIKSAMLQSQSLWLPVCSAVTPLERWLAERTFERGYIAHCEQDQPRINLPLTTSPHLSTCILIGPEGDFDTEEIRLALSRGFTAVSLGDSRLRTETAAIYALSILRYSSEHIHL